jgi:hypothetical protein
VANLIACVDAAVQAQATSFYVEILATHGVRMKKPMSTDVGMDEDND